MKVSAKVRELADECFPGSNFYKSYCNLEVTKEVNRENNNVN